MENDFILEKLEQDCFRDISKNIYIFSILLFFHCAKVKLRIG